MPLIAARGVDLLDRHDRRLVERGLDDRGRAGQRVEHADLDFAARRIGERAFLIQMCGKPAAAAAPPQRFPSGMSVDRCSSFLPRTNEKNAPAHTMVAWSDTWGVLAPRFELSQRRRCRGAPSAD
jgi:hypothetical protein